MAKGRYWGWLDGCFGVLLIQCYERWLCVNLRVRGFGVEGGIVTHGFYGNEYLPLHKKLQCQTVTERHRENSERVSFNRCGDSLLLSSALLPFLNLVNWKSAIKKAI